MGPRDLTPPHDLSIYPNNITNNTSSNTADITKNLSLIHPGNETSPTPPYYNHQTHSQFTLISELSDYSEEELQKILTRGPPKEILPLLNNSRNTSPPYPH